MYNTPQVHSYLCPFFPLFLWPESNERRKFARPLSSACMDSLFCVRKRGYYIKPLI